MAMMFGRFEIQSELSKSDTALIYKALDTKTNQVVALNTTSLVPLGERSSAFVETLIAEGEGALPGEPEHRGLLARSIPTYAGHLAAANTFSAPSTRWSSATWRRAWQVYSAKYRS